MTFITKSTCLVGHSCAGAACDCPALLDSMVPAQTALGQTAANPRSRLGCIYVPHGATMDKWTPAQEGKGFAFTEILQPLEKYRDRLVVVSNLAHPQAAALAADAGAGPRQPIQAVCSSWSVRTSRRKKRFHVRHHHRSRSWRKARVQGHTAAVVRMSDRGKNGAELPGCRLRSAHTTNTISGKNAHSAGCLWSIIRSCF